MNLDYRNLGYKFYTTILKKTNVGAIIGKNQSAAIKNGTILNTFSTNRGVIYVSQGLNSNPAWISLDFREPFTQ